MKTTQYNSLGGVGVKAVAIKCVQCETLIRVRAIKEDDENKRYVQVSGKYTCIVCHKKISREK